MTLMLGLTLGFGRVAVTFAQEEPKRKKKGKEKKSEEPKKDLH